MKHHKGTRQSTGATGKTRKFLVIKMSSGLSSKNSHATTACVVEVCVICTHVHSCADEIEIWEILVDRGIENESIYIQEISPLNAVTQIVYTVNTSNTSTPLMHRWCVCKLSCSPSCSSSPPLMCNLSLCLPHPSCPTFLRPLIISCIPQQISLTLSAVKHLSLQP